MPKQPFLVLRSGLCVPLEGEYHCELLEGAWYVLGHNAVVPCGSRRAADRMREMLLHEHDAHALAAEALEGLPTEFQVVGETH